MDMNGEYRIRVPRAAVWAALNDPEMLKTAIAGCEEITRETDSAFVVAVTAKLGPVKARFRGRLTLSDIDPPNGYTISGEGQGGPAGFASGRAKVRLEDDGAGDTLLKYEVEAHIGGKLAQIGSRIVAGAAKKMADDFFSALAAGAEARAGSEAKPDAARSAEAGEGQGALRAGATPGTERQGLRPAYWVAGLVLVIAAILFVFAIR